MNMVPKVKLLKIFCHLINLNTVGTMVQYIEPFNSLLKTLNPKQLKKHLSFSLSISLTVLHCLTLFLSLAWCLVPQARTARTWCGRWVSSSAWLYYAQAILCTPVANITDCATSPAKTSSYLIYFIKIILKQIQMVYFLELFK